MSALERETHSLQDIFTFVFSVARHHRVARKKMNPMCLSRLVMWCRAPMPWLAKVADKAVLSMYLNNAVAKGG